MSRRGIRQRKRLSNYRFDFARHVHAEQLVEFSPQEGATGLQASQTNSNHREVLAYHFQRMKPRRFEQGLQSTHPASLSIRPRRDGKAVHHKPTGWTQARLALGERFTSDRIHRHFDSVRREFAHCLDNVALGVIDRMIHSDLPKIILFRGPRRPEYHQAMRFRELDRSNSHAPGGSVNQDSIARLQVSHREHRMISRQIVNRNRCALLERHSRGQAVGHRRGHSNPAGVAVELRERRNGVARTQRLTFPGFPLSAFDHLLDDTGDFNSRYEWRFRSAGIDTHSLQQIREVDADGLHANQYFSRFRLRVGYFPRLKNFRRPVPPYDHCAHLSSFERFRWSRLLLQPPGRKLAPAFYLGM